MMMRWPSPKLLFAERRRHDVLRRLQAFAAACAHEEFHAVLAVRD